MDDEAEDRAAKNKYHATVTDKQTSLNDHIRNEVHEILVRCIKRTSYDDIFDEAKRRSASGRIEEQELKDLLHNLCLIAEDEVRRVIKYVITGGQILADNFYKELQEAQ